MFKFTGSVKSDRVVSNECRAFSKYNAKLAHCCGAFLKDADIDERLAPISHARRWTPTYEDYLVQHLGIAFFCRKPSYPLIQQGSKEVVINVDGHPLYVWEQHEDYCKENIGISPEKYPSEFVEWNKGDITINVQYLHSGSLTYWLSSIWPTYLRHAGPTPPTDNYFMFVGTIDQMDERATNKLHNSVLLIHVSGDIHNLNYSKSENPRLKWVLIRNDPKKLKEMQ